ncbi:MAG TPA: prepilin-type N-terminal cleavage/methylation domain-containing protein [Chitinispirillaceae bacterium]|nr:prepilin-type N-terminal cleavage/methylation domain-containing protein [Chitinispirillaceae bacterium]
MTFKPGLNCSGLTLIEITVSLFISSVIVTSAYKANQYLTKSTLHETEKSSLQREIITVNDILSKDIRMAGLNLPGNGIRVTTNDNTNDIVELYSNDSGFQTTLSAVPGYSDDVMHVVNGAGMYTDHWVCISESNEDTIFRQIKRVGMNASGPDTIYMYDALEITLSSGTKVYPASRVKYSINSSSGGLIRSLNGAPLPLASTIDSLEFIPKSLTGTEVGYMGRSAAVLSVFIGGRLKSGSSYSVISDSIEINLRNRG